MRRESATELENPLNRKAEKAIGYYFFNKISHF